MIMQLFVVIIIGAFSFWIVGTNKSTIRHTGDRDVLNIVYSIALYSTILLLAVNLNNKYILPFFDLNLISKLFDIPNSIILLHFFISIIVLVYSRFLFRTIYLAATSDRVIIHPILIFGAGEAGIITYNALTKDTKYNYDVVAFIDDNTNKVGKKINGIPILATTKITKAYIDGNNIKEVIISTNNIGSSRLIEITDQFLDFDIKIKTIPALSNWIDEGLSMSQIKDINIDDLLDRDVIDINNPIVKKEVENKIVMVTGAAGSIGSELCRQLINYPISKLILIDNSESSLYNLEQDLHLSGHSNFVAIVSDIRDKKNMQKLFSKLTPQKVYHAAAYKHVPLMEISPYEAVCVNILGTKNIADCSVEFGVQSFVMVSTDKAVNPTNVMGATKRAAEMYISYLSENKNNTKFTITRFGNVLGSNGSVIPLFKKQINQGGPLSLTHPEITRFFMTIPEACSLVLEAGTMGKGGEIYIFDMGNSIKIFDLAKRMIALSGLNYPNDIEIEIIGLRPGEKLHEELLANGENSQETHHDKILIAKNNSINFLKIKNIINTYLNEIEDLTNLKIVELLKLMVPEFISNNSKFEKLDDKK